MEPSLTMRVSARANRFPTPIRKLALADAAMARGIHVHSLNIGQPDVPTPRPFLEALHAYDRSVIAYGRSEGEPAYRLALSGYYRAAGIELDESDLVVTIGGSEAILFALQIVAEPGDEVLCFEPFYTNYNTFAMMSGVTLRPLRTEAANGFHLPDDQTILAAITPRTKAILICSPNNPTGTVLTESELRRLVRMAKDHGLFIISDEVYREFVYEGTPPAFWISKASMTTPSWWIAFRSATALAAPASDVSPPAIRKSARPPSEWPRAGSARRWWSKPRRWPWPSWASAFSDPCAKNTCAAGTSPSKASNAFRALFARNPKAPFTSWRSCPLQTAGPPAGC